MSERRETQSNKRPRMNCLLFFLHYLQKVIVFFGRCFFALIHSNGGKRIPPIENQLLHDSAMSLAEKIRTKKITSEEVVKVFIQRIKEVNPILNCLVEERFSEALKEAQEADQLISSGKLTEAQLAKDKPLLGVPFTTKDCIAVKGLHHTAGVVMRKNVIAQEDAHALSCIRKAGAIPLGLTNVSELCMWWESHNRLHGRTSNPYNTTRGVGGSSGGEGCMQTAAGSAFGIGSDIGGSIRMPAIFNGVFGHKPSKFIVSNKGQFPIPNSEHIESFLGLGPLTRRATDLKPLLEILSDENSSKLKLNEPVDLKNLKVYYQKNNSNAPLVCEVEPAIRMALMNAVRHMNKVTNVEAKEMAIKKLAKSNAIWLANMRAKDSLSFAERITGKDGTKHIIIEVFKSIFGLSPNTFIGLMTALFEKVGPQPGSSHHGHLLRQRAELEAEFVSFLKDDGVFLYPTHPTAALYHNEPLLRAMNFSYTAIINCLGLPATHIPMGLNEDGLPIGIQVVSNFNNDRFCLAVAEELEKAFGGWIPPPGKI